MSGRMLIGIERVLLEEHPDVVLVYGDANFTLPGALAAAEPHIPVAHIETCLRSFNMRMPEEVDRILTHRISRWLFALTEAAVKHLRREDFQDDQILPVGDVMFGVALRHGSRVKFESDLLVKPGLDVLVTIHRAENTDHVQRLANVVHTLEVRAQFLPVVWPLHPRTCAILQQMGRLDKLSCQIHLIEPLGHLDAVQLEKYVAVIAMDSGSVQKEFFFYLVPCVTVRDETEWTELVEAGWNRVAPPNGADQLAATIQRAVGSKGTAVVPCSDGRAAQKIVARLAEDLAA